MKAEATIDAHAFERASRELEHAGFDRQAGRTVAWALRRSGNAIRRHVRAEARRHRKKGRLSSNVRTYIKGEGMAVEVRVKSAGPVAHLIIGGVQPHGITSAGVMTIHAPGRNGAVIGFAHAVQNPGFPGDPYFHRGVVGARPEVNEIIGKAADTMVKELAYRMSRR